MNILFEEYDLKEWKLIYVTLHKSVSNNWDVMDLEFFNDLQKYLQSKAEKIGLDPLDHDTWINWLNNTKKCGVSVQTKDRTESTEKYGAVLPEIPESLGKRQLKEQFSLEKTGVELQGL